MLKDICIMLDDIVLPVNPEEIQWDLPTESATYNVLGIGQVEILQGTNLQEVQVEGFLPKYKHHFVYEDAMDLPDYIERLRKMEEENEVVHFVYTGDTQDINFFGSVHDLNLTERGGDVGVWHYSFVFREWRDYSAKQIQKPSDTGGKKRPKKKNPEPKQSQGGKYTVKKGDNLHRIAKQTLGDSSRWRELYALNKDIIKNPNLIYPGQEFQLPTNSNGTLNKTGKNATSNIVYNDANQLEAQYKSSGREVGKTEYTMEHSVYETTAR